MFMYAKDVIGKDFKKVELNAPANLMWKDCWWVTTATGLESFLYTT
jgi:hypothetical protein